MSRSRAEQSGNGTNHLTNLVGGSIALRKERRNSSVLCILYISSFFFTLITYYYTTPTYYNYTSPILSLNNSVTVFTPTSGNTLTTTNSNIRYPKCLFKYPSPQISNSASTSLTHSSFSSEAKNRLAIRGGIKSRIESAQWRLISFCSASEGGGGAGGGSVELGKRVWRSCWRSGGRRVGG